MANNVLDNSNISKHLGQTSRYKSTYDPKLLVKEPRENNRQYLNIFNDSLPFVGSDTWNAYECSFLLDNGLPVTGVLKINYPCNSEYIVESKSIKLYLNSFNMQKMGSDKLDAIKKFEETVSNDLTSLLGGQASVFFHLGHQVDSFNIGARREWDIGEYENVDLQDINELKITQYTEDPALIEGMFDEGVEVEQKFYSGLLKSNCRVTSQPDWGDVFIHLKSNVVINPQSILKYVISFRDECHFHEEICECIYKRLYDMCNPSELFVMCLYARRGGIDINPVRATSNELIARLAPGLVDTSVAHIKTSKQ